MIQFRRTPFMLFRNTAVKNIETNRLVIHIQPDEGISLSFGAKVPGAVMRLGLVNMDFDYKTYFGMEHGTGYERLLRDCMAGDATLFQRSDMVEAGWKVIQPIIDVWHALPARGFPELRGGFLGASRSGGTTGTRRPRMAPRRRRGDRSSAGGSPPRSHDKGRFRAMTQALLVK